MAFAAVLYYVYKDWAVERVRKWNLNKGYQVRQLWCEKYPLLPTSKITHTSGKLICIPLRQGEEGQMGIRHVFFLLCDVLFIIKIANLYLLQK